VFLVAIYTVRGVLFHKLGSLECSVPVVLGSVIYHTLQDEDYHPLIFVNLYDLLICLPGQLEDTACQNQQCCGPAYMHVAVKTLQCTEVQKYDVKNCHTCNASALWDVGRSVCWTIISLSLTHTLFQTRRSSWECISLSSDFL